VLREISGKLTASIFKITTKTIIVTLRRKAAKYPELRWLLMSVDVRIIPQHLYPFLATPL
jgi:hypothetical protein